MNETHLTENKMSSATARISMGSFVCLYYIMTFLNNNGTSRGFFATAHGGINISMATAKLLVMMDDAAGNEASLRLIHCVRIKSGPLEHPSYLREMLANLNEKFAQHS